MESSNVSTMLEQNMLSVLLWVPLVLSGISLLIPRSIQRGFAITAAFFLSAFTIYQCCLGHAEQTIPWLNGLGIQLGFRLDALSKWFVIFTAITTLVAVTLVGPWYKRYPRLFVSSAFFLAFALNMAFLSTNLIAFYFAYEAVFVPMILMVGIWGTQNKASSVLRFFLVSFLGSILMLVSILYLMSLYHSQTGQYTAQIFDLLQVSKSIDPMQLQWAFFGFFLAFAIKVPMVPFHGWLKEVYVAAPMPATIWMSAILSKLGVFGFIRFVIPMFESQVVQYQSTLVTLATVSVIYAAFLAIQAKQPKELLAYSSISHLGFVMLGVFTLSSGGTGAAVLLSVGHTLASAMLFLILYHVQDRSGPLLLDHYHGLSRSYPVLFTLFFVGVLASVSLPGTVNFVGEFLVLTFAYPVTALGTVLSGLGVVFGAVYMLKLFQRLGFGTASVQKNSDVITRDLSAFEVGVVLMMVGLILYLGFQPAVVLRGF
jgi:NADH-quinone oxidoreductase subunit M